MKILFLTPRFPYPPIKGDKLRPYYFIKHLSQKHEIVLISIIENKEDKKWINQLSSYCKRIEVFYLPSILSKIHSIHALFNDLPFQVEYYYSPQLKKLITKVVNEEKPDILFANLIRMSLYLEDISLPKIIDFVDALSLNYSRISRFRSYSPYGVFINQEAKRVQKFEKRTLRNYDHALITTQKDKVYIENTEKISVIPVGIELNKFPFSFNNSPAKNIIFTGNMGYAPNIDAILYFVNSIFPVILSKIPDCELIIAGASPPKTIKKLNKTNHIKVLGYVESIHSVMSSGKIFICPIRFGAGIKTKLLEAMSSGLPIISTSSGCEGLEVIENRHLLVADSPEDFARKTIILLKDDELRKTLASNARELIESKYQWDIIFTELNRIITRLGVR